MDSRKSKPSQSLVSAVGQLERELQVLAVKAKAELTDPHNSIVGEIRAELVADCFRSLKLIAIGHKYR